MYPQQDKLFCCKGIVKQDKLVGEHRIYPLTNSDLCIPFVWAYYLLYELDENRYMVMKVHYI
jgi:hypothetical protein